MKVLSRTLFTLGVVVLLVGLVSGVANRQVLDAGRFAQHVDAVRADPDVSRQLGIVVTDQLLESQPDLVGLRPLLESASATLVSSSALGPVVRAAVAPLHRALASGDDDQVVLKLADVGALLVAAITTLSPEAQATIPPNLDVQLAAFGGQETTAKVISLTHLVAVLSWLLPILGLILLAAAALVRERDLRRVGRTLGRGVLISAAVLALLLVVGGFAPSMVDRQTLGGALVGGVWGELDGSFWLTVAVAAAAGFLISVVSSPGFHLDPATMLDRARAWLVHRPETAKGQASRGLLLAGVGVLTLARPLTVVAVVVAVVGFLVLLTGLRDLVALVADLLRRDSRGSKPLSVTRSRDIGVRGIAVVSVIALVAVFVLGALPADDDLDDTVTVSATAGPCNGHVELCDRPYNEVAFPATHNSMSAADQAGWFLAEQPDGIMSQLDRGVRVFLIDSWYGQPSQRPGIIANTAESRQKALDLAEETYGSSVVDSALRIRDALNLKPSGEAKPYLCHALCELGATEWEPLMKQVRTWMDAHPREVVTFFIQDEVSPADTAALVKRAGLMPYVHTQQKGEAWPTLGTMISSGKRAVFLMEHTSGGTEYPWLLDGNTWVQDTPFTFTKADQFSCDRLRGEADAPLFLVNHWLSNFASRVSDADVVNAPDVLVPRLQKCQQERGMVPNYVAVDNYDRGDLMGAVDTINGFS